MVQQRVFAAKAKSILSSLYLVLSRLHLEYDVQIWIPQDKGDTDILERV